jgi:hypothetical protein
MLGYLRLEIMVRKSAISLETGCVKDDKDYVKCKKTDRNSKLNPNTLLGTCMFQMRKTALLYTDYDGIRLAANLLNL